MHVFKVKKMEEKIMDDEIRNELKYRLILARYSEDDSLNEAYLLKQLVDLYHKYNVKMSNNMKEHIKEEIKKIEKNLKPIYEKKKKEFESLKDKFGNKINLDKEVKDGIFTKDELNKFREKNNL